MTLLINFGIIDHKVGLDSSRPIDIHRRKTNESIIESHTSNHIHLIWFAANMNKLAQQLTTWKICDTINLLNTQTPNWFIQFIIVYWSFHHWSHLYANTSRKLFLLCIHSILYCYLKYKNPCTIIPQNYFKINIFHVPFKMALAFESTCVVHTSRQPRLSSHSIRFAVDFN